VDAEECGWMRKDDKGLDICGLIWMVVLCSAWMRRDVDEGERMTKVWIYVEGYGWL